jgi:hypothetical protein
MAIFIHALSPIRPPSVKCSETVLKRFLNALNQIREFYFKYLTIYGIFILKKISKSLTNASSLTDVDLISPIFHGPPHFFDLLCLSMIVPALYMCNVHAARNPTWVLVMTRWLSVLDRLGDGIMSGVTRQ